MTVLRQRHYLGHTAAGPDDPHRQLTPEEVMALKDRGWMPMIDGAPGDRYVAWYPPDKLEYNDIPF